MPALRRAWSFFFEEGRKFPPEARFAVSQAAIISAIAALNPVEDDPSSNEKEGFNGITAKLKLTCSIAECKTEQEASKEIIAAMGKASLSTKERKQMMQAIYKVLDQD